MIGTGWNSDIDRAGSDVNDPRIDYTLSLQGISTLGNTENIAHTMLSEIFYHFCVHDVNEGAWWRNFVGVFVYAWTKGINKIFAVYIAEKKWEKNFNWSKFEEIIQRLLLNVGNVKMLWT